MPPAFESQEYWDTRFTSNPNSFDWLEAPTAFDPYLIPALKSGREKHPQILHIGCGTSLLSHHLRKYVERPEQVHNVDYSKVAIELGQKHEREMLRKATPAASQNTPSHTQRNGTPECMRWSFADLLDAHHLTDIDPPLTYSVILDKSTSDSVACSNDIQTTLPYPLSMAPKQQTVPSSDVSTEALHPLHILAIHLALLTKLGGKWITISYSEDRYTFLKENFQASPALPRPSRKDRHSDPTPDARDDDTDDGSLNDSVDDMPPHVIGGSVPDPGLLWRLENKYEIEVPPAPKLNADGTESVSHQPKIMHWVYVLVRTEQELYIVPGDDKN